MNASDSTILLNHPNDIDFWYLCHHAQGMYSGRDVQQLEQPKQNNTDSERGTKKSLEDWLDGL